MHEMFRISLFRILRRHPSYSGRGGGGRLTMHRRVMFAQQFW